MAAGSKDRRERAAAARAAAQASEKRRERTVRIIGAAAVLAVVAGIIGVALYARSSDETASRVDVVEPDPSAPVPQGVLGAGSEWAFGVPYGTGSDSVPVLELWEDFQCPACVALEQTNGAGIAELADTGVIRLIWRPTAFQDRSLGNDASNRAVAAWGCAIDAGFTREYHDAIYNNEPAVQGDGWTNQQLIGFAGDIGMSGDTLETFTQCVNDGTYRPWAANSTQEFYDGSIPGTPYVKIDGVEVPNATVADQAALLAAVTVAAGN
jgi:protein-disulfide isomerase